MKLHVIFLKLVEANRNNNNIRRLRQVAKFLYKN